ncbi:hypothetical protein PAECIP111893_04244 [Paenibacillus plantiphilus]|uniref:Uncharacterized protein n=2 Tax=Paenibacillus plantiphilus TaxID=2905650 RepID=A0ABM9CLV8_9BACL|nr:hypothetical protein PAECIP111893_04244 [Paenibacillus plantiphilus]
MKARRIWTLLMTLMLLIASAPLALAATTMELTVSSQAALDKTIAAASSTQQTAIKGLQLDLVIIGQKEQALDGSIRSVHYKNEAELLALRSRIKQIDADTIKKLEKQVQEMKERYKPLFSLYTTLNQQITAAKGIKNKDLNALLRAQADTAKLAVHFARQDIKAQESLLTAAKKSAKAAKKRIQETLSGMGTLNIRIKSARSEAAASKKRIAPLLAAFKQAIKKTQVKETLDSLTSIVAHSRQITVHKQAILNLENQISGIINKAKAQLPSIR